ncbi:MAG: nucleotidyltransferase substrate binding protein [Deltaproteobacteria bacterium]|nr:nucleotidyltransferase substrate binding protein [Deltaproteobacteria bacterium]
MKLDLSSLVSALSQLDESLGYSRSETARSDPKLFRQFRNSVVQCYEFTYELCWKMLKRRLELDAPSAGSVDGLSFRDLFRLGAEHGLVEDPIRWFEYREHRNETSHVYDEAKAERVYETAAAFLDDAQRLLHELERRNGP